MDTEQDEFKVKVRPLKKSGIEIVKLKSVDMDKIKEIYPKRRMKL